MAKEEKRTIGDDLIGASVTTNCSTVADEMLVNTSEEQQNAFKELLNSEK